MGAYASEYAPRAGRRNTSHFGANPVQESKLNEKTSL
jgi:hypothetical protein